MPRIRVEFDVPERGVCVNGWQRCQHAHMKSMTCQIFNEKITAPEFIRLPQCIAAEKDAVSGWRDIADAPLNTEIILYWKNSKHCEDGYVYRDDDGALRLVLFDGQSLNDAPTHFLPLPPPPVGK